jgi:hypothetical protein
MDRKMLVIAASLSAFAVAAPASAQEFSGMGPHQMRPRHFDRFGSGRRDMPRCFAGDPRQMRGNARFDCRAQADGWFYDDGAWAAYNNRGWDPDSYNDWWNDRPDRAFPRWVQEQHARGTCEPDRMWWSGTGWHC